jgi:hypothetical protein
LIAAIFVASLTFTSFWGFILSAITTKIEIVIFAVGLGLLVPTLAISYVHYFFSSLWNKQHPSVRLLRWFPPRNSLWEGVYATLVMLLSFIASLIIILPFLSKITCNFYETAEQLASCSELTEIALNQYREQYHLDEIGAAVWLIVAAYLYQTEYLIRHRVVPKVKVALQNYHSGRSASRQKPQKLVKKLLIILLIPLVAVGIYLFSQLPEIKETLPVPVADQAPSVTPTPVTSASPASSPQPDSFREAVNKAMSAATITQSAKSKDDWNLVASQWQEAIALMKAVPASSPNYAVAQKKVVEYQPNLDYALSVASRAQ